MYHPIENFWIIHPTLQSLQGGIRGFGPQVAHGLARLGFGDELLQMYEYHRGQEIGPALAQWRAKVNRELHANTNGHFDRRATALNLPDNFPNLEVLKYYINPVTFQGRNGGGSMGMRDKLTLNVSRTAEFCENNFTEWASRTMIIHRFRELVWEAAVMQLLRRVSLEADEKERARNGTVGREIHGAINPLVEDAVGTHVGLVRKYLDATANHLSRNGGDELFVNRTGQAAVGPSSQGSGPDPHPLFEDIVGYREHVSTDYLPEYRVNINPTHLVKLANSGIRGKVPQPTTLPQRKEPHADPSDSLRMWLPVSMMRQVHPDLVQAYERSQELKKARKGKQRATADDEDGDTPSSSPAKPPRRARKSQSQHDGPDAPSSSQIGSQPSSQASGSQPRPHPRPKPPAASQANGEAPVDMLLQPIACVALAMEGGSAMAPLPRRVSLPRRGYESFFFTFPDPDNPDEVIWGENHDDDHRGRDLSLLAASHTRTRMWADPVPLAASQSVSAQRRLPSPVAPVAPPPASSQRKQAAPRPRKRAQPAHQFVDDSEDEDDYMVDGHQMSQREQLFDRILGGPMKRKPQGGGANRPAPQRKRGRATTAGDSEAQEVHNPPKRPKPAGSGVAGPSRATQQLAVNNSSSGMSSNVRIEAGPSRLASTPRVSLEARSFPTLPPLDDPFDRSIAPPRHVPFSQAREIADFSDDEVELVPAPSGSGRRPSKVLQAMRSLDERLFPASSQQSRLSSASNEDDVIEISD